MTIQLTTGQLEALVEALYDADVIDDLDSDAVSLGYSGRGMYGARCLAFVTGGTDVAAFVFELAVVLSGDQRGEVNDLEDAAYVLRSAIAEIGSPERDSMGLETVYYWRNITAADEEDT